MIFHKKDKKKKLAFMAPPEVYPPGAVAYNGGDEVFHIVYALIFALQMYEKACQIMPREADALKPIAEHWEKLFIKNQKYVDDCIK